MKERDLTFIKLNVKILRIVTFIDILFINNKNLLS